MSAEIKIESGVPLPPPRGEINRVLARMVAGDSFLVPLSMNLSSLRAAATRYGIEHNMRFAVRKSPKGPRCWRIK